MAFRQILLMIGITTVVTEFGIHVVYLTLTGRAGIEDEAFSYLGDICDGVSQPRRESRKVSVSIVERGA